MSSENSTIDSLMKKGWVSPTSQEHVLGKFQGKGLGPNKLILLTGLKNRFGATYFQAFLQNARGETSQKPIITGLYNQGSYPSYNWIEIINYSERASFGVGKEFLDISLHTLTYKLFQYLAELIPPGGHMMVEYDSPEQQDTADSLALGIPPAATPLGYLLFLIGCGTGFKDWHFAEGGSEGPRKLQGYKALNREHTKQKIGETTKELTKFLERLSLKDVSELERVARDRALDILNRLKRQEDL